jgi:hypothetical protein
VFLLIQYIKGVSIIICVTIVVVDHYSLWFRCCISISLSPYWLLKDSEGLSVAERDLKNLKEQLNDDIPVGPLIKKCCTLDQVEIC